MTGFTRYCHSAWFRRMLELSVTAFCFDPNPSFAFQRTQDFADWTKPFSQRFDEDYLLPSRTGQLPNSPLNHAHLILNLQPTGFVA
jgi:hypothetical protein